jgi:hypothetical protein
MSEASLINYGAHDDRGKIAKLAPRAGGFRIGAVPPTPERRREQQVAQVAAILAIVVGCALAGWALLRAFDDKPPPLPLIVGLLAAAGLEITTGALMLAHRRAAWSFAVSLTGVLVAAGIIALPAIVRAGVAPPLAAVALGAGIVLLVLLALCKEVF